eukprot:CAMPEP_0182446920 /NCGR_PEP_ID=MMETSP1172-20130603/8873_1 /TAXON_ID=708627 /ORGANISM="Timspurckia oligopyrenoides, Strain CCMP3278" /LENGTH=626 /DNA_ID=CAMNT_0024643109 /DNA_START=117 /DNA_END=1997 /DNA_ORIENTATION=+
MDEALIPVQFNMPNSGEERSEPARILDDFVVWIVKKGEDVSASFPSVENRVPMSVLDDPKFKENSVLVAEGYLKAPSGDAAHDAATQVEEVAPQKVRIVGLKEWCIEYGPLPSLWFHSSQAWYRLAEPHPTYIEAHDIVRTKFEVCSRAYILATTMNSKAATYKTIIRLLSFEYASMRAYTESQILGIKEFIIDQAASLEDQSLIKTVFLKTLKDRQRREQEAKGVTGSELVLGRRWKPTPESSKAKSLYFTRMLRAIQGLAKQRAAWAFVEPVDPIAHGCPDYFSVVKTPMDLGTIEKMIVTGSYANVEDIVSDVRLVWTNCRLYNPPGSELVKCANILEEKFEEMMVGIDSAVKKELKTKGASALGSKSSSEKLQNTKIAALVAKEDPADFSQVSTASILSEFESLTEKLVVKPQSTGLCMNPSCFNKPRMMSRYCSMECGFILAQLRIEYKTSFNGSESSFDKVLRRLRKEAKQALNMNVKGPPRRRIDPNDPSAAGRQKKRRKVDKGEVTAPAANASPNSGAAEKSGGNANKVVVRQPAKPEIAVKNPKANVNEEQESSSKGEGDTRNVNSASKSPADRGSSGSEVESESVSRSGEETTGANGDDPFESDVQEVETDVDDSD